MSRFKSFLFALAIAVVLTTLVWAAMVGVLFILTEFGALGFWTMMVIGLTIWIYRNI